MQLQLDVAPAAVFSPVTSLKRIGLLQKAYVLSI
jgi:hypothetical protein